MRCDLLGSAVPDLLLLPEALDFDAGHSWVSSRAQREQADADQETFLLWRLGDLEFRPHVRGSEPLKPRK